MHSVITDIKQSYRLYIFTFYVGNLIILLITMFIILIMI